MLRATGRLILAAWRPTTVSNRPIFLASNIAGGKNQKDGRNVSSFHRKANAKLSRERSRLERLVGDYYLRALAIDTFRASSFSSAISARQFSFMDCIS